MRHRAHKPAGTQFHSKILLGDLAIFAVLDVLLDLQPTALDAFPGLKAFYAHVKGLPRMAEAVNVPAYFKTA